MLRMGLGDIAAFPFVDPPDSKAINDGFKLLQELGAVSQDRRITNVGRQLGQLPVDPRLGRMLVEANQKQCFKRSADYCQRLGGSGPERAASREAAGCGSTASGVLSRGFGLSDLM